MKQTLNCILLLTLYISWAFAEEAQTQLNLQGIPNPPQLLGVECHIKDATIQWRPMGDNLAPILYYIIQYNTSFIPEEWKDFGQAPSSDSIYNVNLAPWANYTFRVIAVNKIGQSKPSLHSEVCTTPAEVPRTNPDNVRLEGDEDNLVITWTPMPQIEHGGPGFKYRVGWKRAINGEDYEFVDIDNYKQNRLIIPNQPYFHLYYIVVGAANELGQANVAPLTVTGYSGESKPVRAPTNFTLLDILGPTTALFSWEPVPKESIRGHFKGYKIKIWSKTSPIAKDIYVKGDTSKALISNFDPYTTCYAQVNVFNNKYDGPPSDVISFNTPEGRPEGMQGLEAYPLGSTGFLLKWDKPDKPNGILTGYNIYWSKIDSGMVNEPNSRIPQIADPNVNTAKLDGLQADSSYRIYITATSKAGESHRYFIEKNTRQHGNYKPSKPSFEWVFVNPDRTSVRIHWLPAEDGNGGTYFLVKYKKRGELNFHCCDEKYEDWIIISGLEDSTVYEFIVTAVDGPSPDLFTDSDMQEISTYSKPETLLIQPVSTTSDHKQGPKSGYGDGDSVDGIKPEVIPSTPPHSNKQFIEGTSRD
ncbi:unnamed protein product [Psylliodes chrysocephalus]|uniref:Fibronectin type-III domain-containing protein n=1 Tax=Psylliodes chrysocephalus TaxID=3402493 RepID=A0A9P0D7B9_9CUCU|nr:unnamed protein product [Psylliodes chrysocephala]